MFRIGIACVSLLAASGGAMAESAVERGFYLVNTIMACGNCHTPRDADGKTIAEKAFSGGLTFTTPAFIATAPNITPDNETGIGSWSDAEIKRALVEGVRPDHGRLAGVPLAAIMPANFYKAIRSGAAPIWSASAIAWSATPHGCVAFRISGMDWAAAAGFFPRGKGLLRERQAAPPPTSPPI